METRVAVISIIVSDSKAVDLINSLLHEYRDFIIGRMGLPYKEKNINIISLAVVASMDTISTLAGKLGRLDGVGVKTAIASLGKDE